MIITVSGNITHKGDGFAVIESAGLGYQVFMNERALDSVDVGNKVRLWAYEHIREDTHDIYGFADEAEYKLFSRVVGVSGVGPRMALSILSLGKVQEIEKMIEKGDVTWISQVPGVGKKTAQKIILELKGKLVDDGSVSGEDEEVLAALVTLGYRREKARDALCRMGTGDGKSVEDRLRAALQELGR